jgi:AcrR family transcriptional regulator
LSIAKNTPKAQKTREIILKAALELFREKGYEQTSMRDIAEKAGVAVGAAYYYFRTKDEMILETFTQSQYESEARNKEICGETRSFKKRFLDLMFFRLDILAGHRKLFVILTQNGINPANPLSPFSVESSSLREAALRILQQSIEGSDLKISSSLRPCLPKLLWFVQMVIVLFWALDNSGNQSRTRRLVEISMDMMIPLFKLSMLPLAGFFNRMIIEIHDLLSGMIREESIVP